MTGTALAAHLGVVVAIGLVAGIVTATLAGAVRRLTGGW